uniref:Uncharacterized protein n=1 Tax=Romanomermis culicivorax TaxID=13658 RepID=A0A915J7H9_ROMCU
MTRQMLEPEMQEAFINPPTPTQQEIDQVKKEAKKELELFSIKLVKKQQRLDPKLMHIFKKIAENTKPSLKHWLEPQDGIVEG